jgi:glycosyltransferase involved in cell wall biosynthesis
MIRRVGVRGGIVNVRRRLSGQPPLYPHQQAVRNANRVDERRYARRALLVYLPAAFYYPEGHPEFRRHQNLTRTRIMARVLDEAGYVVDVANKKDGHFRPRGRYDLVVSERHWQPLARLGPDATRVFLATSLQHRVHNRNTHRRHDLMEARGRTPMRRDPNWPEGLEALQDAHAVIGNGNATTAASWREAFAGPLHFFDTFPPGELHVEPGERDPERARRSFLFFASRNQVRKGLDLALEAFAELPEAELHVCSNVLEEGAFGEAYRRELRAPNVHVHGWVDVHGPEFAALVRSCGFVVHPSCSEGQAGAVVQCLSSGLVPVVTPETGLDVGDLGAVLHEESPTALAALVRTLAEQPPAELADRATAAYDLARARHTPAAFERRFREILGALVPA